MRISNLVNLQGQLGSQGGAKEGKDHADRRLPPGDEALPGEPDGGEGGAHGGAELVGGNGVVGRDPGDQVGGEGNQPSSTCHRVHKTAQKDQRAHDHKRKEGQCHHGSLLI